jgi:hypothetical protein
LAAELWSSFSRFAISLAPGLARGRIGGRALS